jgi:integrase
MRLGELLGLRWCNVDLDMASLSVVQALYKRCGVCKMIKPKSSHSRRRIALSPSLALLLRDHKAEQQAQRILLGTPLFDSDLVFCHPGGRPLDPGVISHTFAKALRKAGLPHIRFHDLRHSHATLLLKAGIHPKIVSERLGHANIGITLDTYSHVLPGLQERAAECFDNLVARQNVGNGL